MGLTVDVEAEKAWKKLSETQRSVFVGYGTRASYSGSRRIAAALVKQGLAEWDERGPDSFLWAVTWTPMGVRVAALAQRLKEAT